MNFRSFKSFQDLSFHNSTLNFQSDPMDRMPSFTPKSVSGCAVYAWVMHLGTLVVVTNTDGALVAETLTPEATDLNVGLGDALVGEMGLARMSRTA
jgi:hypothetical protein